MSGQYGNHNLSIQDCEQGFLEDQVQIFLEGYVHTKTGVFETAYFFDETAVRPHETSEPHCYKNRSPERFTAPSSRILTPHSSPR